MATRIAALILGLFLSWATLGNISTVSATAPKSSQPATPSGSDNASPAPDPQPRYREGRNSQTAPQPASGANAAAPRPQQEPYLRNNFELIRSYLPDLGNGLLVLAIGALVAYLIRLLLLRILSRTGLDPFLERNGLIGRTPNSRSGENHGFEAAALHRASIRESEPYQSYFGRSPARRWRPDESVRYERSKLERAEDIPSHQRDPSWSESESEPEGGQFEQRPGGGSPAEHPPIYENKTENFSEERYSFDTAEPADHPSVSGDAQEFLAREEFDPERHQAAEAPEETEPQPRLRRAEDLYRARIGTRLIANTAFWIIVIAALMEACRAARLYSFASGLEDILSYIPHLIAAVLIFVGSILVANWIRARLVSGDASTASLIGGAVRAGILTIGGFMALRELQIAPDIVRIAFILAFGAIALATALALGLGSRKVAEQMTSDIYDENSSKLREFGRRLRNDPDKAA
jgi:hypothetical protein